LKEYAFNSVPVDGVQTYLNARGAEGYVLLVQLPARKEIGAEGEKTIETTVSIYITMEREANPARATPAAAPPAPPNPFEVARKALERFGPEGPKTEAEWQEYISMGGKR
jgi:hypothetical protein